MRYGIYFMDGRYCAYGTSMDYYDIVNESFSSWMIALYLNKEVRGLGLFNKVYFKSLSRSSAFNFSVIKSYVRKGNERALEIYHSQGFMDYKLDLYEVDILKNYGKPGFKEQEEKKKQLAEVVDNF